MPISRSFPRSGSEDWDWQLNANCKGMDISQFYSPENERGFNRARRERIAKAICGGCPVLNNCLTWALKAREPYGVWGGMSTEERDLLLAKQPS